MDTIETGDLERLYKRVEEERLSDKQQTLDYLRKDSSENIVRKETSPLRELAETVFKPKEIEQQIDSADSISNVKDVERGIDDVQIPSRVPILKKQGESKKDDLFDVLLGEWKTSSTARASLKRRLPGLDYDLTKIKWHGFKWKGRDAVGIWDAVSGDWITWWTTSEVPEGISEIKSIEPPVEEE